jgi:hypothetical protein
LAEKIPIGTSQQFFDTNATQTGASVMAGSITLTKMERSAPRGRNRQTLLAGALLLTSTGPVLAQTSWPQVAVPSGIVLADQGGQVTANGLPVRMRGFTSAAGPVKVAELFRHSLGQPLVEDRVGAKLVLGRSHGAYYLTVQFEAAGTGTRGVIAVTELTAALNGAAASRDADQRLLAKLAAGFSIVNRTASSDARRRVEHVVLTNHHSIALSVASIKGMLGADGFTFERETRAGNEPNHPQSAKPRDARTLFFRKTGGEAIAVVSRDDTGRTAVVLNTTSYLEHAK